MLNSMIAITHHVRSVIGLGSFSISRKKIGAMRRLFIKWYLCYLKNKKYDLGGSLRLSEGIWRGKQMYEIKFFFYGTLMDFDIEIDNIEIEKVAAITKGRLYNLGPFPGAKFSEDADTHVIGQVILFRSDKHGPIDTVVKTCDMIEGFSENHPLSSFYIRKKIKVITEDGNELLCHAYEINYSDERLARSAKFVHHGDWLKDERDGGYELRWKEKTYEEKTS